MVATFKVLLLVWSALFIELLVDKIECCFPRGPTETKPGKYSGKKLIIILIDGFRWDYLNKTGLHGFERIKKEGVHAQYMEPVFPSLSYPNYYSITTGRYVENHGITLNYMWNPETNESMSSKSYWWEGAEPLWITATRSGIRTDMRLWPGCEAEIFGIRPTSCAPYELHLWVDSFRQDLEDITAMMESDQSDLGLIYCEQPDVFGHIFGPESHLLDSTIRTLDSIMNTWMSRLAEKNLRDKVNVIIVSDHGMTPVDSWAATKIPLADYLDLENVDKILDRGAIVGIFPKAGKTDVVVDRLRHMKGTKVWKKEDLPDKFHYKSVWTPPVILLADPKYYIKAMPNGEKTILSFSYIPPPLADSLLSGTHGYDPDVMPDMRGIFLAFGPDLKAGLEAPPIKNIDVYNLAMALIGQEPISNNGTWDSVKEFLKCSPKICSP